VTNSPAYYNTEEVAAVESFIVMAQQDLLSLLQDMKQIFFSLKQEIGVWWEFITNHD